MDTLDWTAKWADYTPDKIALTSYDTNKSYTYADLHLFANRLTNIFLEFQLEEGDRVAVLAEHSLEYMVLFVACQRVGIILVPLNYRLSKKEIGNLISDCTPKLLVYSAAQKDKVYHQLNNLKMVDMDSINKYYQTIGEVSEKSFQIKADNPLFIFYTSGTTGAPKGVIYTNKMLFWNSLNTSMQLGITFRDSTINILPPYHTSGWNIFITPLLHKGAHIGLLEKFDAEKTLCLLELNKTTLFMALPTMLLMMQQTPTFKKANLKKLRYIISGGEKVPSKLVDYWKQKKTSISGRAMALPKLDRASHPYIIKWPS